MLGIENQRGMHGAHPGCTGRLTMQQMQEVSADRVIIGLHLDTLAIVAEVIPVQQHGAQAGHQLVSNIPGAGMVVILLFRLQTTQYRYAGAHYVHGMG